MDLTQGYFDEMHLNGPVSEKVSFNRAITALSKSAKRLKYIGIGLVEIKEPVPEHRFFATKLTQTKLRR
jgi:hypothetical protein